MKILSTLLFLLVTHVFAAVQTPPPIGTYLFTQKFELTGCAEYAEGRGAIAHCKKTETKKFSINDKIKVQEFFWDDQTKSFGAKYVHLGTNRSIPMTVIKLDRTF